MHVVGCTGIRLSGFNLDPALGQLSGGPVDVVLLEAPYVQLEWPGLRSPVALVVKGLRAEVVQKQIPQVSLPCTHVCASQGSLNAVPICRVVPRDTALWLRNCVAHLTCWEDQVAQHSLALP